MEKVGNVWNKACLKKLHSAQEIGIHLSWYLPDYKSFVDFVIGLHHTRGSAFSYLKHAHTTRFEKISWWGRWKPNGCSATSCCGKTLHRGYTNVNQHMWSTRVVSIQWELKVKFRRCKKNSLIYWLMLASQARLFIVAWQHHQLMSPCRWLVSYCSESTDTDTQSSRRFSAVMKGPITTDKQEMILHLFIRLLSGQLASKSACILQHCPLRGWKKDKSDQL